LIPIAFSLSFWTFLSVLFWKKKDFPIVFAFTLIVFLLTKSSLVLGEKYFGHVDTLGTYLAVTEFLQMIKEMSFFEYLNVWDPFVNAGQPLDIKFDTFFYLFIFLNKISPFPLSSESLHNMISLNYLFGFTCGMCMLARLLFKNNWSPFFVLISILFGNLVVVSYFQEATRWMYFYPFFILSFCLWLEQKKWSFFLTCFFIVTTTSTYLPNALFIFLSNLFVPDSLLKEYNTFFYLA